MYFIYVIMTGVFIIIHVLFYCMCGILTYIVTQGRKYLHDDPYMGNNLWQNVGRLMI